MKNCANCRGELTNSYGYSSIYNQEDEEILLCVPCFHDEDAMIEEKGTNNLPDVLAKYKKNIEELNSF